MYDEIVISRNSKGEFTQITFIKDYIIEYCGPFEPKYHNEYLNLEITKYLQSKYE
jgi:hypothetical protein